MTDFEIFCARHTCKECPYGKEPDSISCELAYMKDTQEITNRKQPLSSKIESLLREIDKLFAR